MIQPNKPLSRALRSASVFCFTILLGACNGGAAPDNEAGAASPSDAKTPVASKAGEPREKQAPIDPQRGGPTAVTVNWQDLRSGMALHDTDSVTFKLSNESQTEQRVRLVAVASGLDGRLVEHPIDTVQLKAGEKQLRKLSIDSIPLQSLGSPSFVAVTAEIEREDSEPLQVPTRPLYYVFSNEYHDVMLYDEDEVAMLPAYDMFAVRGRVLAENGTWTDVSDIGASGQGLSRVEFLPATNQPPDSAIPAGVEQEAIDKGLLPVTGSDSVGKVTQALNSSVRLCTTWRVQFVDSNLDEDFWKDTGWGDFSASTAHATVYNEPSHTQVWQDQLDVNGCVQLSLTNGAKYSITQDTDPIGANSFFSVRRPVNGVGTKVSVSSAFTMPAGGASSVVIHPPLNNDAVQAAAVAGAIIYMHYVGLISGLGGMGLVPGGYVILTQTGCPGIIPATDSCYNPGEDIVHLGTTDIDGFPDAHWKYIIAHEIGHHVQNRSMGSHSYDYGDDAVELLCRCDHYDPKLYSNREHCIQSREIVGGAALEGFAHAFASRIWNRTTENDGIQIYYKPFLRAQDFLVTYPPVRFNLMNNVRWMEDKCFKAGRGVEMDWAQFYYQVTNEATPNFTTMAGLFDIYRKACTGSTSTKCNGEAVSWVMLQTAAKSYYGGSSADPRYARFKTTGINTGVTN